jgi:preprotein translocase subunit YajC
MTHLLATSPLAASSGGGGGGGSIAFLVLIGLFAVVYVVFLRPARSRQRKAVAQRSRASVGDRVTTTAGLIATVVAIDDDEVTLEVAPGVHCQYLPAAILRVISDTESNDDESTDVEPSDTESPDDAEPHPTAVDEPTDS